MTTLLGIDIETTGLNPENDKVIEIGLVLWDVTDNIPVDFSSALVSQRGIPDEITNLTGITQRVVDADYRSITNPLEYVRENSYKADYLVVHNAGFEKSFLGDFDKHWIDTLCDIPYPPMKGNGSLSDICMVHGIFNPMPHRALFDAFAMMQLLAKYDFQAVLARSQEPTILLVADLPFERKDEAKNLGYRWNRSEAPKAWSKKLKQSEVESELQKATFPCRQLTA